MKSKLIAVFFIMMLTIAGCSGSKPQTPEDKIAHINTLLSKGFEMPDNQLEKINTAIEEAKNLLSQDKKEEADKLLKQTIKTLEFLEEADRFNKSE
jgi:hypothetical protein